MSRVNRWARQQARSTKLSWAIADGHARGRACMMNNMRVLSDAITRFPSPRDIEPTNPSPDDHPLALLVEAEQKPAGWPIRPTSGRT